MELFTLMHAKVLYLRFCAIYDHKFVKNHHDDDFKSLWANEWSSGLANINPNVIKDALDYCKKNLDWPPSIAEFIKICESYLGIPSLQECMKLAINREFNHPLVLICYEKIGSWALKNDTEKQLTLKFQAAYQDALNKFRQDEDSTWEQLENYNAKPKELPPPSKIPTAGESAAFRECMNKCREILQGKKITNGEKTYKQFDANKINPRHREFDKAIFEDYKAYLMSVPETETMTLPPVYVLDRNKFLNMQEQPEYLRKAGYIPPSQRAPNESPKSSDRNKGPNTAYKSWMKEWS